MSPADIEEWVGRGRDRGCAEALLCLGDRPESAFAEYRRTLAQWGHTGTVEYLDWVARAALNAGLLPHTNAGILSRDEMARLKNVNVSLGLMLENVADRLCAKGMPHHRAPDKRPARRIRMLEEAGELRIPMTTGILVGIGETRRERIEALLAIRRIHREYGHIQEVIVQAFRAHPATPMRDAAEAIDSDLAHAIAAARLILDPDVVVQAPPNLNADSIELLLDAGVNDFGGISPVTPDYINSGHAWPHVDRLSEVCRRAGFELAPRLAVHDAFVEKEGFLCEALRGPTHAARARLAQPRAA
jgi:FO synthase